MGAAGTPNLLLLFVNPAPRNLPLFYFILFGKLFNPLKTMLDCYNTHFPYTQHESILD